MPAFLVAAAAAAAAEAAGDPAEALFARCLSDPVKVQYGKHGVGLLSTQPSGFDQAQNLLGHVDTLSTLPHKTVARVDIHI